MSEALVLLVLVWAALLVPSALRSRKGSPHVTVGGFERAMNVLRTDLGSQASSRQLLVPEDAVRIVEREPHEPGADGAPGPPGPVRRAEPPVIVQRRARFVRLLVGTGASFLLALVVAGWTWFVFLAVLAATAGYAVLLRRLKLQRDEARRVVADLELRREPLAQTAGIAAGDGWNSGVRLRRWDD